MPLITRITISPITGNKSYYPFINTLMIPTILCILLAGLLAIFFLPDNEAIFRVSLLTSATICLLCSLLCLNVHTSAYWFQFHCDLTFLHPFLTLGVDGLSASLVWLTSFLIYISIQLSSPQDLPAYRYREYMSWLLILELALITAFTSTDIILFFIAFEVSLIPLYLLIGSWGGREARSVAAIYLFLFTLAGSLLLLLALLCIFAETGTTKLTILNLIGLDCGGCALASCIALWLGFAVKLPAFGLHIWLPRAHVEATVAGSVLLAGILLKLGGYGLIRLSLSLFPESMVYLQPLLWTWALLGVLVCSASALSDFDLKRIVAYSSVAHMGIILLGLRDANLGALALMLAHAFTSSGLFICVSVIYSNCSTKNLCLLGGITTTAPLLSSALFLFTLGNIGLPLTGNFPAEVMVLKGVSQVNLIVAALGLTSLVLSAAYSLRLFSRVAHGPVKIVCQDLDRKGLANLLPLAAVLIALGIWPELFLQICSIRLDLLT